MLAHHTHDESTSEMFKGEIHFPYCLVKLNLMFLNNFSCKQIIKNDEVSDGYPGILHY